jgi:cobalt-zinc-cadmium efflux system membrane fusion protein
MNLHKRGFSLFVLLALAGACRTAPPAEAPPADEEPPSLAVTIWSERSELFMEYPPLVAGAEARFAIHLTDLSNFQPLREGKVVVRFEGDTIQRFEVDAPSTPGIFGVDVKVPAARRYQMAVEVHHPQFRDEHRVGAVTVYADQAAALAAVPADDEGATAFLKEQQWTLDFATMRVDEGARREVVSVPATIEPRVGGSAEVRAPSAGRLATGGGRAIGTAVSRNATLVELIVRNERLGEAPVLRLELLQAQAALRVAQEDRARVERLANAGAIPQRRLTEARASEETAAARVKIAQEQLQHLELSRTGQGSGDPGERVAVRAPISGIIAESSATPGATVEEGQLLYRIVALDRVHVVGAVPEQHLARLENSTSAEIDVPGLATPLTTTRLVSIGRVVDPQKRSVPITFELAKPPASVAVGQGVTLRLITAPKSNEIAIPVDAVIDDGGQPIVFVQAGGESFERRPVRVGGAREGGFVQIVSGVEAGERIVTRGAHLVRLAALSPQTPGHGHVH